MSEGLGPQIDEVYDSILTAFRDAWEVGTPDVTGDVPPIEWPDQPSAQTPLSEGDVPWARITVHHFERGGTTLAGPSIGRKYANHGAVMVNIFIPAGKRGLAVLGRLGKVALDVFEGPQLDSGIRFKDAVYREAGVDGNWLQGNVRAGFYYENHKQ